MTSNDNPHDTAAQIASKLTSDEWVVLTFLHNPMSMPEGGPVLRMAPSISWPPRSIKFSTTCINSLSRHMSGDKVEKIYRSLVQRGLIHDRWNASLQGLMPIPGPQTTQLGAEVKRARSHWS